MRRGLLIVLPIVLATTGCGNKPKEQAVDTTLPDQIVEEQSNGIEDNGASTAGGISKSLPYREAASDYSDGHGSAYDDASSSAAYQSRDDYEPIQESGPTPAIPRGNVGNWVNTNDYPSAALQQEREGMTEFTVTVGTDGRVSNCSISASSGHADLDMATCSNVSRRARFQPATNEDGDAVTGGYTNRVRWQIPR